MNPILTAEERPPVGERILIHDGETVVGATLLSYLSPDWLFYHTDTGKQLAVDEVERWWKIPKMKP